LSLTATFDSLRKLGHSLVLTARREDRENSASSDTLKDTGTAYLMNTAEIYPGINALLGFGKDLSSQTSDSATIRTNGSQMSIGADMVPHRTLLINLTYNWTRSVQEAGGDAPAPGTTARMSRTSGASVSYTPLSSFYLFGSLYRTQETGQPTRTTQYFTGSYNLAQFGGALEVRLIYTEDLQADTDTTNRTYGPYVKWKINYRTYIDCSYLTMLSKSPSQRTETKMVNTSFHWYF
jgi:hypothetical protein